MNSFDEDNKFYEGLIDEYVRLPEGIDPIIPTTGRAIIDEAVDNIQPYEIQVRYSARGFSKTAQDEADVVARFLKNVWIYWRQKSSDIDVVRDFIKKLFMHGKACWKIIPDWTLWPELDEAVEEELKLSGALKETVEMIKQMRKENFPIVCRSIPPTKFMEDPSMDARKLWLVEQYEVSIEEIRNRISQWDEELIDPLLRSVNVYELWTATYIDNNGKVHPGRFYVFINEDCVNGENGELNPYWDIPYVVKYSGFGTETMDGKPERKATGFFSRQVKSMLKAEMRRHTQFEALMQQLAFPIIFLPDTIEDLDIDLTPGMVNYIPEDTMAMTKNMYLQATLPAPEYMQSINAIQGQIERGTTQRAIRGAGVPGTDSAAQLSMVTAQAKLRLEPVRKVTEEAVDLVNSMILRYIEKVLKEPVSIWAAEPDGPEAYMLSPKKIKGRYHTISEFQPSDDQVKERKLMLVSEAMTKAGLNPYDAFVYAGWENATEVISRNLAYSIMQEPAIKRALAVRAAEEWGLNVDELIMESMQDQIKQQQMMQQMMNPQAGAQPQMGQQQSDTGHPPQQPQGSGGIARQAIGRPEDQVNQAPDVGALLNDFQGLQ